MHTHFMLAALSQARLGRGICAPNPAVGAVAVLNQEIIAQAFHSGAGSPHAEQKLLAELPEDCTNISVYVTLEPCNHWGRTPPCTEALIAKRVASVVYGFVDPNPEVSKNNSHEQLKAHGIEVIHFPLPEIDAFYQSYAYWIQTGRPWVSVKIAQSFDGKIAGPNGVPVALSNDACFELTHACRRATDVILTTAKTVNADNPAFNVRLQGMPTMKKKVAIIEGRDTLSRTAQIFDTAASCWVYRAESLKEPPDERPCVTYVGVPSVKNRLDLSAILMHLGQQGCHDVWVEAGRLLFHALHQAGLVNQTYLYFAPRVLGQEALSLYTSSDLFERPYHITWCPMKDNMVAILDWS